MRLETHDVGDGRAEQTLPLTVGSCDPRVDPEVVEARAGVPSGVERLRQWVGRRSASRYLGWEELQAGLGRYRPEDLPGMIEVMREAQLACLTGLQDLNVRPRDARRQVPAEEAPRPVNVFARAGVVEPLGGRLEWLQTVHRYLAWELQSYEEAGASAARLR